MFPYDAQLSAALQSRPETVSEVLATMQALDAVMADDDGLKWFNWLYMQVTMTVEQRVAGSSFRGPAWLAELDVQFARLYFDALANWLRGAPAAGCWTALFLKRSDGAVARIQFAMAGINAHINHDLPIAIGATCDATQTRPEHDSAQYQDYTGINQTLDGLVDMAKRTLMVRLLGDALPPVSRLEDTIAAWNVAAAREAAWVNAEVLWSLRAMARLSARYLATLDGITTVAGKALLVPVPLVTATLQPASRRAGSAL
jgi:hypothetical protein